MGRVHKKGACNEQTESTAGVTRRRRGGDAAIIWRWRGGGAEEKGRRSCGCDAAGVKLRGGTSDKAGKQVELQEVGA